jgi:hypothetical protein
VRDEVILLAEDNADMAEMFVMVLDRSGFTNEVVIARDGWRRWTTCSAGASTPDETPLIHLAWLCWT